MKVRVLYFAALKDLRGVAEESLDLPDDVTDVRGTVSFLEAKYALANATAQCRVAVNEEFVALNHPIAEGDIVALIPPVSGG